MVSSFSKPASKKGFVYPQITQQIVNELNIGWCYNWNTINTIELSVPYTPMCWGSAPKDLVAITNLSNATELLGFNEPDGVLQSNLTVQQAISLWPQLQATGLRLGSPATAGNPTNPTGWLAEFMTAAKANNYRVDFICVHWYAPPNADSFVKELDNLYALYNLPIWITEFSPADWKASLANPTKYLAHDAINFMNQLIPELQSRPYIERFAWKTRPTGDPNLGFAALFNDDGSLTTVGQAYATF
jgi:hypothetical protein